MIKHYCDGCGKEYIPSKDTSVFTYLELKSILVSGNQTIQPREANNEFCPPCTEKIKKCIKGLEK